MNEQTANTIILAARRAAESGRELAPNTIELLEQIAESPFPESVRLEAEILLGLECMA